MGCGWAGNKNGFLKVSHRGFLCFILAVFLCCIRVPFSDAAQGDYLIVLHGIGRTNQNMQTVSDHFTAQGYLVLNLNYASRDKELKNLSTDIHQKITKFTTDPNKPIHFITHSMGGLVARAYITQYKPKNIARVVMLGPPNQGSEVADFFKENWLFQGYYGPAGQQLKTDQQMIKAVLGEVNFDLGVIAGDRSIDPVSSIIIPGKDDGKVAIERTKVSGMADHIVLHVTHTFMMKNKQVIEQAQYFIEHGFFKKTPQ